MKVLYIGNHRDSTGWARAACDYTLALDAAGIDVTVRTVKYNSVKGEVDSRILKLENKPHPAKYDAVIQQVLPPQFEYDSRLGKNIGSFFTETESYAGSDWPEYANLMDGLLLPNTQAKKAAELSGVTKPIGIAPCPTDISRFHKRQKPLALREKYPDSFIFYFISEFQPRKNLRALVEAFHLEFETWENVELVIKTSAHGVNLGQDVFDEFLTGIKQDLRIYPKIEHYKAEHVLLGHYSQENILRLHATGDCFVMPSSAEGWSIPLMDALGMGNPAIANGYFEFLPYVSEENSWLVDYRMEPVTGMLSAPPATSVGRDNWAKIDVNALRAAMREAFENRELSKQKGNAGFHKVQEFSYRNVGTIMKKELEKFL